MGEACTMAGWHIHARNHDHLFVETRCLACKPAILAAGMDSLCHKMLPDPHFPRQRLRLNDNWQLSRRLRTESVQLSALVLAASLFVGCASPRPVSWREAAVQSHPWGHYSGAPVTSWNPDGRSMTLLRELRYTDPKGIVWVAPAGSVVDGASIPRSLWSFMGGPFEGKYRNASVLHDVSYDEKQRLPQDCDRMFYDAMRCSGVGAVEAKTMYYSLL